MGKKNKTPSSGLKEKRKGLSIRGAIIAGVFGGVIFGVNFGFQALVGLFGMPGATGFITGLTVPFALALASQINKEWGTATLVWTLYSLFAIPTLLMGLPGPYKLLLGFCGGLAYDLGYCGLQFRKVGLYIALVLYTTVLAIGFYVVWKFGLFPDISEKSVVQILIVISSVFFVEGVASTWLSTWFYKNRLSDLAE